MDHFHRFFTLLQHVIGADLAFVANLTRGPVKCPVQKNDTGWFLSLFTIVLTSFHSCLCINPR